VIRMAMLVLVLVGCGAGEQPARVGDPTLMLICEKAEPKEAVVECQGEVRPSRRT
jgi:hypothetical protein